MAKSIGVRTSLVLLGLAGSIVFAATASTQAQDAAPPQQEASAPTPAPAPAASDCSFIGCLLSSGAAPAAAPPAQPAPADVTQVAPVADEPDAPMKAKPRPKPQHVVTIAADASDAARLTGLVETMPRGKVKIVKTDSAKADAEADFQVATVLDPHAGSEKAKLFTEQMHILAGAGIQSVADLRDKVVSFGRDHSASQMAARKAFEALNISVRETPLDLDNALDGLATGDVAAVVVLAPQPVARFEKLSAPGLHLVSWPQDGALPAGAVASTIDATRYPGLAKPEPGASEQAIRAVGIDAVLTMSAHGARQPGSKLFLAALAQHSAALSRRGFDLLKADLDTRGGRRFASEDAR